ncbi:MAG: hypothetical protein A3H96_17125 [Acidobacteria bacterium RIFCSPLOWO2_02_FULL_67_36]|nr:MAG: hypothetical protein A3H96_17125 [Acidobacteria bacterium RIFCSPLOWO2_02_FULL_67_36]OFW20654.1 MAG: hypothetical protein A3G21_22300 [Acidobacteria bacterium RIFCSPLOWO2_12_FULL_66_21]
MTEREWREASDLRTSRLGLAAVLATAAVLRFWGIGHGIPHAVEVDEPEIVERAFNMMRTGSLNPNQFFDYPTLYMYVQLVVSVVRFVTGALTGAWTSLAQATSPSFYLWGRAVTAAFGVATVLLVFRIGLRWGGRHALLAAGLLAVMPLHVRQSHYVLTDIPLTFFTTLALLASLVAHERARLGAFAIAGAAAGLAAATKYNGGIALLLPLLACWMTPAVRPSRLLCSLAAIGAAFVAFLIAAPYTLLDLPAFLDGFARLTAAYRHNPAPPEAGWMLYLKYLRGTLGWPALLLALSGFVLGVVRFVRGPGRVRWALLVVFCLVHFWTIARQNIVYGRYLLPMVPAVCVLAATAVVSGVSLLRRYEIPRAPRTALIAALTVAALLPPAIQAVRYDRMLVRRGTADMAYDWIREHLPANAAIVIESRGLILPRNVYKSRNVVQLRMEHYQNYVSGGIDYLIASSQSFGPYLYDTGPQRFPEEYAQYMHIFEQSRELARFTPSADVPGPELRIFQVRH